MIAYCERRLIARYYKTRRPAGFFFVYRGQIYRLAVGPNDEATRQAAQTRLESLRAELNAFAPFAVILRVLEHTGARPGEVYNASAERWDRELGAFVYPAADKVEGEGLTHKKCAAGVGARRLHRRSHLAAVCGSSLREVPRGADFPKPCGPAVDRQLCFLSLRPTEKTSWRYPAHLAVQLPPHVDNPHGRGGASSFTDR